MAQKFDARQMISRDVLANLLGVNGTELDDLLRALNKEINAPLRISASSPADSKINFQPSEVESADLAAKNVSPVSSQIPTFPASTIDFQTGATTGGTINITFPNSTVGFYRRVGFSLDSSGTIQAVFSAEAATLGALANAGTIFVSGALPIGWIDLEATAASPGRFKTAGSASNIIEHKVSGSNRVHRIEGGGGASSASGGINYISNSGADAGVTGWATYADAAAASPIDGTGGSANITWTATSSSPLRGTASFLLTKDAANRQGQGASYDFTIADADKAKVLTISFEYEIASGTYADGDVRVYIYDVTNATVIEPAGRSILNAGIESKHVATFQTASNSTNYRLIFHVASTSAAAYALKLDTISVGPSAVVQGTVITDWQSYTPTYTGFGTVSGASAYWRRVGDSIEIRGNFTVGTPTATEARISLPGVTSSSAMGGLAAAGDMLRGTYASATYFRHTVLMEPSVGYVTFGWQQAGNGGLIKRNGDAVSAAGDVFSYHARIPIAGWSSSQVLSSDTDTRVVAAKVTKSGTQAISTETKITGWSSIRDTVGMWDNVNNRFNILIPGDYNFTFGAFLGNSTELNTILAYRINGGSSEYLAGHSFSGDARLNGKALLPNLKAGDYIEAYVYTTGATTTVAAVGTMLSMERISGPAQIAASESVNCRYTSSSGQTINNTRPTLIFTTKDYDSHNAMNTSTGAYTVPLSGKYQIKAGFVITVNLSTSQDIEVQVKVNSTVKSELNRVYGNGTSQAYGVHGSDTINCVAGDIITVTGFSSVSASAIADSTYNYVAIERVGN